MPVHLQLDLVKQFGTALALYQFSPHKIVIVPQDRSSWIFVEYPTPVQSFTPFHAVPKYTHQILTVVFLWYSAVPTSVPTASGFKWNILRTGSCVCNEVLHILCVLAHFEQLLLHYTVASASRLKWDILVGWVAVCAMKGCLATDQREWALSRFLPIVGWLVHCWCRLALSMVFTLNCASAMVVIPLLWKHGGADIQTRWCWRSSMVVVTIWLFKHGGGDTRAWWWWHQGCSPITRLLLTSGACKQFSTHLTLRYWSSLSPPWHNKQWIVKVGQSLDRLGGWGVDWWYSHLGSKPAWIEALGRLAGRVSPNHPRPGITLPNTKLPPITLSVTKTLVCTGPGLR